MGRADTRDAGNARASTRAVATGGAGIPAGTAAGRLRETIYVQKRMFG